MASPELRDDSGLPGNRPQLFGLAAAAVCLGFAAFTGHIWEDYFITFRASLNLATGHGLVFQPGERVHTFTSPLGTLLPAFFALGGGDNVALRALWGLRLVSAAAVGAAVWLGVRAFRRDGLAPLAATTAALAWIFDAKTVDFSMNGMETGLIVFLVLYTWHAFTSGARFWPCVLACAGLQWTRPDGCVYFAAIAGAWLLLGGRARGAELSSDEGSPREDTPAKSRHLLGHPTSHEAGHVRRAWNRVARLVRGGTLKREVRPLQQDESPEACAVSIQNDIGNYCEMEAGCPHPAGFRLRPASPRGEGTAPPSNRTDDVGDDETLTRSAAIRRRGLFLLQVIAIAVVLYLPWFVFAWSYYGSPLPHTILAKANFSADGGVLRQLVLTPWNLLFGDVPLHDLFQPAYHFFGGWPEGLHWVSRLIAVGAALAWIWRRVAPAGRMASAAFFLGSFYVNIVPPFPWYYPGWQALAFLSWGYLLHALIWKSPAGAAAGGPYRTARIAAAVLVLAQVGVFLGATWQMRTQQTLIENRHRAAIGQWLRQQAGARDTVFLECLGYIGYYSGLKMLDYPGLAAPEVVAARRAGHTKWAEIIDVLHPDWLVLRPDDARRVFGDLPSLKTRYRFARAFNTRAAIDAIPLLPGRGYLNFDSVFLVYRRHPPEADRR